MKKKYEAPTADAVKFEYKDQVVAASGGGQCKATYTWHVIPCRDTIDYRHE